MNKKTKENAINRLTIDHTDEWIYIKSDDKWKTLSSAVIGAGFHTYNQFVNRHVRKDYNADDPIMELKGYLREKGVNGDSLAMMTAAKLQDASFIYSNTLALFAVITVGTSNAVDASKAWKQPKWESTVGTINTWVFIDGFLHESTFVQALITATEAKTKALIDEKIEDPFTKSLATGTSTDSVMIAATQSGQIYDYAGTITDLGKEIGRIVYEGTREAIVKNKMRMGANK